MTLPHELSGKRFGALVAISRDQTAHPYGKSYWVCKCDCGTEREFCAYRLVKGLTISCGCRIKGNGEHRDLHGETGTLAYDAWGGMRSRCNNPKDKNYESYGGRGIKICKRWDSFRLFMKDMGEKPSAAHSIDRIDNDGDYMPSNCKWSTKEEQIYNRRNSKIWVVFGVEYQRCKDAAAQFGVCDMTIRAWCEGIKSKKYPYPPRQNCWSRKKYP